MNIYKGFHIYHNHKKASADNGMVLLEAEIDNCDYEEVLKLMKIEIDRYLIWDKMQSKKINKQRLFNIDVNFGGDM